jgi:hypothetical protein
MTDRHLTIAAMVALVALVAALVLVAASQAA